MGYGLFVPVFFVSTGIAFDLDALIADPSGLATIRAFVLALLVVRGLPALLYPGRANGRGGACVSCEAA